MFVLLAWAPTFAQTVTGSIYGIVTDGSGAVVPHAKIALTNIGTNISLNSQSNDSGDYVFPVVDPGDYKVTVVMIGFTTQAQNNIRLAANQNVNASFVLQTGEVNTIVNIEAGTTMVDTRESQLGETIDQKRIQDLPLVGRSAYDLVQLVPGITGYSASAQIGDNGGTQFNTNGIRGNFNSYYLDASYDTSFFRGGGNILPNPDALGQFRVLTSNFDAEFGRYPGAVVNVITRSGVNTFHGTAYDFLRNDAFNAKNYFNDDVTHLVQNTFGGGVGGPIIRDKAFFYTSYQGLRISTPTIISSAAITVPTALERKGDFRQSAKKPTGTYCGPQYAICLDPVTSNILNFVPLGTGGTAKPPEQIASGNTRADQGTARLDYQLTQSHKLQFTYFNSQGTGFDRTIGGNQLLAYSGNATYAGQSNYVLGDTWIASPSMVNNVTLSYTLNKTIKSNAVDGNRFSDLGSQIRDGGVVSTQPQVTVTGYFTGGVGGSGPSNQSQLSFGLEDTLNWSKGNHAIKLGGSFILNRYTETSAFLSSSKSTFNGNITGNALADFLEGKANTFQQNNGGFHRLHAPNPSLFLQDDWRATRKLTLDLGLRWEVYYPFAGQNNFGTFIPGVQSTRFPTAPLGLLSAGDPGVPDGILKTSYLKFAPRVGFAYDVFGSGKASLRGGYGIFYAASQETLVGNLEQEPFTLAVTLNKTSNYANPYIGIAPFNGVSPFPYVVNLQNPTFVAGASLGGLKPGTSAVPYVQQYNLTLEQQWGNNWSTRLAYVGSVGRLFYLARDQNAPVYEPGGSTTSAGLNARRPLQGYASIGMIDPASNSSYSSMQLTVTRRLANHFSLLASYVWSKTIDNVSADPGSATAYTLSDQYDVSRDRGLSTIHLPHRFVASFLYQLPGTGVGGFLGKEVLSGWQLNGIVTLESGSPFNITSNSDTNLDGIATDRPDVIGNPSLGGGRSRLDKINRYFNTDAYAIPAGHPYGTSPRDPILGPGFVNTDISVFKRFPIVHEDNLMFRAEVFNLFNNVNLGAPNGTLGAPKFGMITSAGTPRIMQLALKYEF
jgi:hypothetical protein